MAHGVNQRAKRPNDIVCATCATKRSEFGLHLGTMGECALVLNDLMDKFHDRAQIFKRELFNVMDDFNSLGCAMLKLSPLFHLIDGETPLD